MTDTVARDTAKPERTPLSRERVMRAAVDVADAEGISAVSMRRIGQELGVEAMSLYNHVANKDELLDGMVDVVFGEIGVPQGEVEWKTAMRERAVSARDVLAHHRWAIGLMESRSSPGPATLRHHDAVIGCLRHAGFSIAMAAHAFSVLDSYIYGFALQQVDLTPETPEDFAAVATQQMVDYEAALADFPHLVRVVGGHVAKVGYDYDAEFRFGLDLILDALDRRLQAAHGE